MDCAWCGSKLNGKKEKWLSGEQTHMGECSNEFANSRGISVTEEKEVEGDKEN